MTRTGPRGSPGHRTREYERDAKAGEDDPDQPVDDALCPEHGRAQLGGGAKERDGGEPDEMGLGDEESVGSLLP